MRLNGTDTGGDVLSKRVTKLPDTVSGNNVQVRGTNGQLGMCVTKCVLFCNLFLFKSFESNETIGQYNLWGSVKSIKLSSINSLDHFDGSCWAPQARVYINKKKAFSNLSIQSIGLIVMDR